MEYAIAGGVTLIFVLIYIFTRPKKRERFSRALKEEEFSEAARELARSLPPPKDGGGDIAEGKDARAVKKALSLSGRQWADEGLARLFLILKDRKDDVKVLLKEDLSSLQDLPSVGGRPRAVILAETVLENSRYIFCEDRVDIATEAFNAARTLTFSETANMKKAFEHVLIRKLSFLCARLGEICRLKRFAERAAKHPRMYSGKAKRLKSVIFSRFAAGELGYDTGKFEERYLALTDELAFYLNNVFDALDNVAIFDFSAYYEPCGILARFDPYVSASPKARENFAEKLCALSTRENLDEYAYAVRLENFGEYGKLPPFAVKRLKVAGGTLVLAHFSDDLLLLARALSSPVMMEFLFGEGSGKKGKSILKIAKIKSSFMPKRRAEEESCGIKIRGDTLFPPILPREAERTECVIVHNGVRHLVRAERSLEPWVRVNGTLMTGVPAVTLGQIPLDVTFGVADNASESAF